MVNMAGKFHLNKDKQRDYEEHYEAAVLSCGLARTGKNSTWCVTCKHFDGRHPHLNFLQKLQTKLPSGHVQTSLSSFLQKPRDVEPRLSQRGKMAHAGIAKGCQGNPTYSPWVQSPSSTPKAIRGHTSWWSSLQ